MFQEILKNVGVDINVSFNLVFISLIWVRILAMGVVIPFILGKPVPRYVLVGASMVMAAFVFTHLVPANPPPLTENFLEIFMLYMKEVFYGLAIGFAVSVMFYALGAAGQMIDEQRGGALARVLIPQLGDQGAISSNFLYQLAIVVYISIGGHLLFFKVFFESFMTLPVLAFPSAGSGMLSLMMLFIKITGNVVAIAIQLSAPILIAIFLTDIILGIANRVAPQINVWMLGFILRGYIGILLLFLALTMITEQIRHYSKESDETTKSVVRYLEKKEVPPEEVVIPEEGLPKDETGSPDVVSP